MGVLDHLHAQGILHRDVKPENLMFQRRGSNDVALIDFDFAARLAPGEKLQQRCGTVGYVAPELLTGQDHDAKADMWSLGSVVYSMLTGEALFNGTPQEVFRQNVLGQIRFGRRFRCLPQDAREFVQSLLALDPE